MKRLFICILILFLGVALFAEKNSDLPRYKGFAIGGDVFGQVPIGDYAQFANANIGLSLAGEYTFPLNLPKNMDLGIGIRAEYGHVFPKSDTSLKSDEEIRAFANIWLRIPFRLFNQYFAFQPEVGGGLSNFFTKYQIDETEKNGTYLSPFISIAPSFRWIPSALQNLEVELTPLFTIVPEKEKTTNMLGLRLGAIWHFEMKNEAMIDETAAEEKRKAKEAKKAEKAEKARLAEEQAKLAEKERLAKEEDRKRAEEAEKARLAAEEAEKKRLAEEEAARQAEEEAKLAEEAEKERLAEEKRLAAEEAERQRLEEERLAEEERKRAEEAERERLAEEERIAAEEAERARIAAEEEEKARLAAEEEAARLAAEEAEKTRLAAEEADKERRAAEEEAARLAAEKPVTSQSTAEEESQPVIEEDEDETEEYAPTSVRLGLKNILFFSKNGAVFSGLSRRQITQNERTIDEAVALIKEHPGCHVLIEGYANNISGTEKENRTACMPLSLWRAEYIKKELIKRGIKAEQIETVGMGGANPLAGRKDRNNWWKNRRVEFVITY